MSNNWLWILVSLPFVPSQFNLHSLLETLGYTVGFLLYTRLRRRLGDPIALSNRWWVIAAASVGALLGSKVLYWFENPWLTFGHWRDLTYLMGGRTIVGGLIGGLAAVEWAKRRIGVQQSTGDLFAVPLCAGISIGRLGCFFEGLPDHTYGTATSLPWGVDFGDGILRHPTQIYEIVFLATLGAALWHLAQRPHTNGDLFKGFMVSYLGFRLLVDFMKPDVRLAGLSSIQWASAAMLFYYQRDLRRWFGVWVAKGSPAAGINRSQTE